MSLTEPDDKFRADLEASHEAVETLARYLRRQGCTIALPAIRCRPNREQFADYADNGDLEILRRLRIEVRHRQFEYGSLAAYPYPTIWVAKVYNWQRAQRAELKPSAYFLVNLSQTAAALVYARTFPQWVVESDKYGVKWYACPKAHALFVRLVEGDA